MSRRMRGSTFDNASVNWLMALAGCIGYAAATERYTLRSIGVTLGYGLFTLCLYFAGDAVHDLFLVRDERDGGLR